MAFILIPENTVNTAQKFTQNHDFSQNIDDKERTANEKDAKTLHWLLGTVYC